MTRDGGRSYLPRHQRPVTENRPSQPAALLVYDRRGCTRLLAIDLDIKVHGQQQVDDDARALTALLERAGLSVISDHSPAGGRHLYVPLAEALPFEQARDLVKALGQLAPTLDVSVMTRVNDSCIRIPGSTHPRGGHQDLDSPLSAAVINLATGSPSAAVRTLMALLAPQLAEQRASRDVKATAQDAGPALQRPLGPRLVAIARTAEHTYRSGSEARQAVITGCAAAGLTLGQVTVRISDGTWPGLASFYARYKTRWHTALARDWSAATSRIKEQKRPGQPHVHKTHTSEPSSHPPVVSNDKKDDQQQVVAHHRAGRDKLYLKDWEVAVLDGERDRWSGRNALGLRMTLRALLVMARAGKSRYVDVGTRAYAIATGFDHGTNAAHLRQLREENNPVVVLIENDRGLRGDLYELLIPVADDDQVIHRRWRRGLTHACRPVFRVLGLPAALVYEALEQPHSGLTVGNLTTLTGLSRASTYDALETLSSWDMATTRAGYWHISDADPAHVGRILGGDLLHNAQVERYRAQRHAWHSQRGLPMTWLDPHGADDPPPGEPRGRWPEAHAPPDTDHAVFEAALALIHNTLGPPSTSAGGN